MIHVVLYEPEIPQNTGNIMRTCMAANVILHLIEPLGFSLDEKHVRRAGMDYIKDLNYTVYSNWESFLEKNHDGEFYYMTRYGKKAPSQFDFTLSDKDIYLVLGKESTGIPRALLSHQLDRCMRLPMVANARSLNLSNCAAIIIYEVLRQLDYPDLCTHETLKGEDWLSE